MRVFFVEDDSVVATALERFCARHPLARTWVRKYFRSPTAALAALDVGHARVDVIATDLRFPDAITGLDFVRLVRAKGSSLPILLYSAKDWSDAERAECLRAGVDDLMSLPLASIQEFLARIQRLGERGPEETPSRCIEVGDIRVDVANRSVTVSGAERTLTPTCLALLSLLAAMFPRTVTYAELLGAMGYAAAGSRHAVAEAVRQLRGRLEGSSVSIEAVAKLGYRLVVPEAATKRPPPRRRPKRARR
jgi:DNA-binding response OmpR family regulator